MSSRIGVDGILIVQRFDRRRSPKKKIPPKYDLEEHLAHSTNTLLTVGRIKYDLWRNRRRRNYNKNINVLYSTTAYMTNKLTKVSWTKCELTLRYSGLISKITRQSLNSFSPRVTLSSNLVSANNMV